MSTKKYKFNKLQLKWLEALESGKYRQGQGALCRILNNDKKEHCCLGVLCEVYNKIYKNKLITKVALNNIIYNNTPDLLPVVVQKKAKLRSIHGFISGNLYESLVFFNDEKGMPFSEIAAFIRGNPEKVFKS